MKSEHVIKYFDHYDPTEEEPDYEPTEEHNFWTQDVQTSLSELLETLPGLVYRCENDREWSMLFISRDCIWLTGYSPAEFLGNAKLTFNDLIHPDDREQVWQAVQAAIRRQQNYRIHYRIQHRDGYLRWVYEQGCGAFNDSGELVFLEGVVLEDHFRDQLESKIADAYDSTAYTQYVNSIAHDLGNLFSVIKNYANTIRCLEQESSSTASLTQRIVQATTKATELLGQLLDWQQDAGELEESFEPAELFQQLRDVLSGLFDDRVALQFEQDVTNWKICVDPTQLERALVNLAINSARAMPVGGNVTISLKQVWLQQSFKCVATLLPPGDYVAFEVTDSGVGMQPDEILKAFEPSYSTRVEGRGLGLPMVLAFSRKSHGGVHVRSQPGKGTEFVLYLPRAIPTPEMSPSIR